MKVKGDYMKAGHEKESLGAERMRFLREHIIFVNDHQGSSAR